MNAAPQIEIFASGRHVAVDGTAHEFASAALDDIVSSYDPASNPAPLVVGHPALDAPAYGWVAAIKREGDKLVAVPEQLEPAFADAVRAGRYKRVSASFYPPDNAANPTPGRWHLKHVGFLGAAAPAVKGLRPVAFAAAAADAPEFEFPEELTMTEQTADFAEQQAALVADREKLEADRRAFEAERNAARATSAAEFAEAQVAAGKLAPAGRSIVAGILATLEAEATVSFGEAGEMSPAAAFKKLFEGSGSLVAFGERAKPDPTRDLPDAKDAGAIAAAATSFAAEQRNKGIEVTAAAAVRHVLNAGV